MDVVKHIKPLKGEAEWPLWRRKIRDMLDYHEGALEVIDGTLICPLPIQDGASPAEIKQYKDACDRYRKANSYAKSMITSALSDEIYQKIMDAGTAFDAWNTLKNL